MNDTDRKPELVQFGDLTPDHFRRHPVWMHCHVADYDEPWYDETDEETFRPYLGELPAGPEGGILLVHADLTLADGTRLEGFVTPASDHDLTDRDGRLGTLQPQLFLPSGERRAFWEGGVPRAPHERHALYQELGKAANAVFPMAFQPKPGLTTGICSGTIEGFYAIERSLFRRKVVVSQ